MLETNSPAAKPYRFDLETYRQFREAVLPEARVELIAGEIVEMAPFGRRHQSCVTRLARLLWRALDDRALVWNQNAIPLTRSQPQPDLALLVPNADDYARRDATPADVLLLVEVADSTVAYPSGDCKGL